MKVNQLLLLFFVIAMIASCSKSSSDPVAIPKTPKLGTTWTYQQDTYGAGGTFTTTTVIHKASSEVSLGGETWLKITDDTLGLVYLLNAKTGGLYQYANSSSNLLCKYPAAVNDVYNTYNYGAAETFTVKETDLTLGAASGTSFSNITRYEGIKGTMLMDVIWYNSEVWFARRETYLLYPFLGTYHKVRWILQSITY